jgi:hypothetical protein
MYGTVFCRFSLLPQADVDLAVEVAVEVDATAKATETLR